MFKKLFAKTSEKTWVNNIAEGILYMLIGIPVYFWGDWVVNRDVTASLSVGTAMVVISAGFVVYGLWGIVNALWRRYRNNDESYNQKLLG